MSSLRNFGTGHACLCFAWSRAGDQWNSLECCNTIVIRLQGTNVNEAKTLIEGCGFRMILADDLEDAAEKAVGVAEIATQAEKIQVGVKFEGFSL